MLIRKNCQKKTKCRTVFLPLWVSIYKKSMSEAMTWNIVEIIDKDAFTQSNEEDCRGVFLRDEISAIAPGSKDQSQETEKL